MTANRYKVHAHERVRDKLITPGEDYTHGVESKYGKHDPNN